MPVSVFRCLLLQSIRPSIYLSIHPSIHPYIHSSICPFIHLSKYLSVYMNRDQSMHGLRTSYLASAYALSHRSRGGPRFNGTRLRAAETPNSPKEAPRDTFFERQGPNNKFSRENKTNFLKRAKHSYSTPTKAEGCRSAKCTVHPTPSTWGILLHHHRHHR